jgi:hypothetical protein
MAEKKKPAAPEQPNETTTKGKRGGANKGIKRVSIPLTERIKKIIDAVKADTLEELGVEITDKQAVMSVWNKGVEAMEAE